MRMEVSTSMWWFISIVTVVIAGCASASSPSISPSSSSAITLFDCAIDFGNMYSEVLTAVCTSNGGDEQTLTIAPRTDNYYRAHVYVKERSYASCSMTLGDRKGTFEVFDWDRDKGYCPDKVCSWVVDELGLILIFQEKVVLKFPWP